MRDRIIAEVERIRAAEASRISFRGDELSVQHEAVEAALSELLDFIRALPPAPPDPCPPWVLEEVESCHGLYAHLATMGDSGASRLVGAFSGLLTTLRAGQEPLGAWTTRLDPGYWELRGDSECHATIWKAPLDYHWRTSADLTQGAALTLKNAQAMAEAVIRTRRALEGRSTGEPT